MSRVSWAKPACVVAILVIVNYAHETLAHLTSYRDLYRRFPFYVPESIDKLAGVCLCLVAVWLLRRNKNIAHEIGFSTSILSAFAFAAVVSCPMWIGFAITRRLTPHIQLVSLLFLTVLSPLVEETEFRGFGVRVMQRTSGWPFWIAVWPSALLVGLGHVDQGQTVQEKIGLFLLTGAGGVTFAWLLYRWRNLWVPIALHVCMNLWWEFFSVSKNALGGWLALVFQNMTMLLAIIVTLWWTANPCAAESRVEESHLSMGTT